MKSLRSFGLILCVSYLIMCSLGCAKRVVRIDLVIFPYCLKGPVLMTGCDDSNPPRCKTSIVTYKKGCEYVQVPHGK